MLSFFPLDVLDEIWDLIESVSEGFLTYCFKYRESIINTIFRTKRCLIILSSVLLIANFLWSREVTNEINFNRSLKASI